MQTDAQRIQCSEKHKILIANQFSKSKIIDCVGELLSRRWNGWHSERHFVFTADGERVKTDRKRSLGLSLGISKGV
jgi:SRSO17 transposase